MRRLIPILILAVAASAEPAEAQPEPAADEQMPADVRRFLQDGSAQKSARLDALKVEIKQLKGTRNQKQRLKALKEEFASLSATREPFVPFLEFPPQQGCVGRLPDPRAQILAVIDAKRCLAQFSAFNGYDAKGQPRFADVAVILDGLPTADFTTQAPTEFDQIFCAVRADGVFEDSTQRFMVLTPFDPASADKWLDQFADEQTKAKRKSNARGPRK